MEDVLSVYQRPYNQTRPVVCVDETSKELHGTPAGIIPLEPGQPIRVDYEYERLGQRNVFMAVEPLAGRRRLSVTERRTTKDFAVFLRFIADDVYPEADIIVLVTDNLNTHGPASLYASFDPETAFRLAQNLSGITRPSTHLGSIWRKSNCRSLADNVYASE